LPLHPSLVHSEHTAPSAACSFSLPYFLFSFVFCRAVVSLSWGLSWFIPVVALQILPATYLLICWSASPKLVSSWHQVAWEPSCFLSVVAWRNFLRLGVQGVRV
jgi:hypothetical protein